MNEENVKLAKIKKSCKAGRIASKVLGIIGIVAFVLVTVGAIVILGMGKNFDNALAEAEGTLNISFKSGIAEARIMGISVGDISNIETDVPAIREMLDDHPMSFVFGSYLLGIAVLVLITTVLLFIISSTFATIEKQDTPFTDKVIRKVTATLIILSVIMLLTIGGGAAIIGLLTTWVIYTILDYGKTLQIQSDETL